METLTLFRFASHGSANTCALTFNWWAAGASAAAYGHCKNTELQKYQMYAHSLILKMDLRAQMDGTADLADLAAANRNDGRHCFRQDPKLKFNSSLIRLHPFTSDTEHNPLRIILVSIYVT